MRVILFDFVYQRGSARCGGMWQSRGKMGLRENGQESDDGPAVAYQAAGTIDS